MSCSRRRCGLGSVTSEGAQSPGAQESIWAGGLGGRGSGGRSGRLRFGSRGPGGGAPWHIQAQGEDVGRRHWTGRRRWRPSRIRPPWGRSERRQGDPGRLGMQTLLKEEETGPEDAGGRRRLAAPDGPGDCDSPRLPRSETGFSRDVGRGRGELARHPEVSRPRGHRPTSAPALGGPRPPGGGDSQGPVILLLLQRILPIVKQIKDAERPTPSHSRGPQVSPDWALPRLFPGFLECLHGHHTTHSPWGLPACTPVTAVEATAFPSWPLLPILSRCHVTVWGPSP